MPANEYFDADAGIVWVQPDGPNTEPLPLLCHNLDSIDEPLGDTTTRMCRTGAGGYEVVHRSQGLPGEPTGTLEAHLSKTRSWLQRAAARRCPMPVYVHEVQCGRSDVFLNYDYGELVKNTLFTSRGKSAMVRAMADAGEGAADMVGLTFDFSGEPLSPEYWKLVESRHAIAEDEPLRDIAFCNPGQWLGPCGPLEDVCTNGVIVADAATGLTADVWFTTDGGAAWAAGAADPFAADEDVNSVVCFQIDRDTTRVVVQRGTTDAGVASEVSYSDDDGDTWTPVDLSAAADSGYGMHSGGLFALNHRYIWAGTDLGQIFFSSDGAVSWTDQAAPDPVAGAQEIYYIHFIDPNYGWAVGDANHAMRTTDGGEHWTIIAGPGQATDVLTCVATIDASRVWVGLSSALGAGELWYSNDEGATWTQRTLPASGGTIPSIGDVMFIDEFCGAVCGTFNDGVDDFPATWRTFNGGHDWERYYDDDNALDGAVAYEGANAVWVCNYNEIYTVGEVSDSTGVVAELEAAGA
jgi:photosystem II stability/assembly factor-like uncharacterized protein